MKRSITKALSVLLAAILILGMLPMSAVAGPSEETIYEAEVFISFPIAGAHPNLTGVPAYDGEPFRVDEVHFFELDQEGHPMGAFLTEEYTFEANREYACQVSLIPKENYRFDSSESNCWINSHDSDCNGVFSGIAFFTTYFTCAPGTVTVSFDANGSADPAPAPIQVPIGGCVWEAIPNYNVVQMPDQPYEKFLGWSLNCFATNSDFFNFYSPVNSDLLLYAMWFHCEDTVELYAELPAACLYDDDCSCVTITVPDRANYGAEGDWLYVGEGNGAPDFHYPAISDYTWPYAVTRGRTYYSRAYVYMDLGAALPTVHLYGGDLISTARLNDYTMEVIYSVTIPAGDSVTKAGVYIETPKAGQNALSYHPEVVSLTPGLEMSVWGWYTDQNLTGDWYEGTLEGGKTYYALVRINGSINYNISYNKLDLSVFGKNAKLVRMVDLASIEGVPNFAGAVVAVTIPKQYDFVVEVPYGGGRFRTDRDSAKWVKIMDFTGVEEGPITLEAKADPEHLFSTWYDAETYDILSRNAKYTFNLDKDVHIKASFAQKPPFEDVGLYDYYYEAVMWAISHDPIITSGADATHFGPKKECTREQIMTFLWNACDAPEPLTTENPFTDVKPTKYYYKAVLWAVENGICTGTTPTTFGVGKSCTRAQAMTFLWNSYGSPEPESSSCPFADVKPGKYYYKAILWALENGVTSGASATAFGVNKICTRAQIITFLYNVYGPKG